MGTSFTIHHQVQSLQRSNIFIFFFVAGKNIHNSSSLLSLQKRHIFITFPSFCSWKFFVEMIIVLFGTYLICASQLATTFCIDGLFKRMQSQIVMTKYADLQFSIVFANSASNSKFKQKSAWSFHQVFIVQHSGNPLPLLKCQRLKLGQVMWRRPKQLGPSYFIVVLTIFQEKAIFNQRVSLNPSRGIRGFT